MYNGIINKMNSELHNPVQYNFFINRAYIDLNKLLNSDISLSWSGKVQCMCGKLFSKFYRQNFCYQCFWNAPQASQSIFKPELCTADLGVEERDLQWEKEFQIAPHYIYLANSSGLKVGITRKTQKITRWIDQGASQAIIIAEVPNRRLSGLIEVAIKKHIADKTNWRKMLSMSPPFIDLIREKEQCLSLIPEYLKKFISQDNHVTEIQYPVLEYPTKIQSLKFEKTSLIKGKLKGIKGQYLILDSNRVFNVRAHSGYIINFSF